MSEMQAQAEMLAESPTVKAAMDTYHAGIASDGGRHRPVARHGQPRARSSRAAHPTGHRHGRGSRRHADRRGGTAAAPAGRVRSAVPTTRRPTSSSWCRRASSAWPRRRSSSRTRSSATCSSGAALDADYAEQLTSLSGAETLIVSRGGIVASTLPAGATRDLTPAMLTTLPEVGQRHAERRAVRDPHAAAARRPVRLHAGLDRRVGRHHPRATRSARCW